MKRALASLSVLMVSASSSFAGGMCGQGGCHQGGRSGMACVVFFLTLALGYWVLRLAEAEKAKVLKVVGRITAWVILLGSLAGLLCPLCGQCKKKGREKVGMTCPYSAAPADAPAAEAAPAEKK